MNTKPNESKQLNRNSSKIWWLGVPIVLALLSVLSLMWAVQPAQAENALATITVDGTCTLPDAVAAANTDSAVNGCPAGTGPDTINFSGVSMVNLTSEVVINSELIIDGGGLVVVDGGNSTRLFNVDSGNVTFANITLQNGNALNNGGAIFGANPTTVITVSFASVLSNTASFGGGISTLGEIVILDSILESNTSINNGGALNLGDDSNAFITRTTIENNSALSHGAISSSGNLTIVDSTVFSNSATTSVGGISSSGNLFIENTAVKFNVSSVSTGGVSASGISTIQDTIVMSNSAKTGGGISNSGEMTIHNSVISGNKADTNGGGISVLEGFTVTVSRSTVSGNIAGEDGGGLNNRGLATIQNSSIHSNSAGESGGGVWNQFGEIRIKQGAIYGNIAVMQGGGIGNLQATIGITNTTISGNNGGETGGGISITSGQVVFDNITVFGNSADVGGGLHTIFPEFDSVLVNNSLFADNINGDCEIADFLSVIFNGANFDSDSSCMALSLNTNIDSTLSANGCLDTHATTSPSVQGCVQTHALLAGSNAIDPAGSTSTLGGDQRDVATFNGVRDSGAYEFATASNFAISKVIESQVGNTITWTILVTNTGDTATATIMDTFPAGTSNHFCTYNGSAGMETIMGDIDVTIEIPTGEAKRFTCSADLDVDLEIRKNISTGGGNLNVVDTDPILAGDVVTFVIEVLNPNLVYLTNVVVDDPLLPACNTTLPATMGLNPLDYTCVDMNVTGSYTNVATVSADYHIPNTATVSDGVITQTATVTATGTITASGEAFVEVMPPTSVTMVDGGVAQSADPLLFLLLGCLLVFATGAGGVGYFRRK